MHFKDDRRNTDRIEKPTMVIMKSLKIFLKRFRHGLIWSMLIGVFALVLSTLIAVFDPYRLLLNWKLVMVEGGEAFELWKTPQAAVYVKVYIFNVTNHEEFLAGIDKKLRFQEVGPYIYREKMEHNNITFNDNGTFTITPGFSLRWVPELNTVTEDDVLILPNIALLGFANFFADTSLITRMSVNLLIHQTKSTAFLRQTVKEFLFNYDSPLVSIGHKFLPSWISFDKLGILDRMYDLTGDSTTIFTGSDDVSKSGTIDNYNGRPYLPHWPSPPCNQVSGSSDGTKFPSMSSNDTEVLFFSKTICRAIPMVRSSELIIHDGIPVHKYIFKNGSFDNGADNPENKCFCRYNKCLKSGLMDVTDCSYGFPIALSAPHFYKSDPSLLNAVEGLNPVEKLHESHFLINQESGTPTQMYLRMQINIPVGEVSTMANSERFSNLVVPLVWSEIAFDTLPRHLLIRFFVYLNFGPIFFVVLKYLLLVVGVAFVTLTVITSLYMTIDNELEYRESSAWRHENQTLMDGVQRRDATRTDTDTRRPTRR
ncbi:scavenger receptor class B member 1-like [Aphis gossypii]|uniref:scavenger receptor class B member 1-like n=1 Tax=Aphis gossypii TaxID=80765 RepID=UPI002158EB8C|nr:scavenger receptor class B member 1-like [Aphis gossypii]